MVVRKLPPSKVPTGDDLDDISFANSKEKGKKKKKEKSPEGGKKKGKKKLLLVGLVVVIAVGAGAYMTVLKKPAATSGHGPTTTAGGPIVTERSLTVNLRDNHYLEFIAALELSAGQTVKTINKYEPMVLDILNSQAEAMTETELLTASGPDKLKADIILAINQQWPDLVENVYFEQFVMQ